MANDGVRLILDLREYRIPIQSPEAFQTFWRAFEQVLAGKAFPAGEPVRVTHPQNGAVSVVFLDSPPPGSQGLHYSVVSILENPKASGHCACCRETGKEAAASYECPTCKTTDPTAGSCDDHVVILAGGVGNDGRMKSNCINHVPTCKGCASPATFWCHGPLCRGEVAWCRSHGRARRQEPEVDYCPACYEALFPECSVANCNEPGTNHCEHVDPVTGQPCGVRLCNRHAARWQVYGPTKIGLGRCSHHRWVKRLGDEDLAWQVVAGTAWRRLDRKGAEWGYSLPSLAAFAHALRNSRGLAYDYAKARQLYLAVGRRGGADAIPTPLRETMKQLMDNAAERWDKDLQKKSRQIHDAAPYLEKLRAAFAAQGLLEASRNVAIADFVPEKTLGNGEIRPAILFIRLAHPLREGVVNLNGMPRKNFAETIGCGLRFEKDER